MTARPRLVRSVPYWVLVVGSVAAGAVGLWLTLDKLGVMTDTLADGSATGVEVYAGQSWAVLGAILIGTGLPIVLVNIHMVLAVLLVAAMTAVIVHLKAPISARGDVPEAAPATSVSSS